MPLATGDKNQMPASAIATSSIDINLLPDEPFFVVYGRDDQFATLVEQWADRREADIRCGTRPPSDRDQVINARHLAATGAEWRRRNNLAWRDAKGPTGVPWNATMAPPPVPAEPVKPDSTLTVPADKVDEALQKPLVPEPIIEEPPTPPDPKVMGMVFTPPSVTPMPRPHLPMPKVMPPVEVRRNLDMGLLREIERAVMVTNTPELYSKLLAFIHRESNFDPKAVAGHGGTAAGLLQFTHVTWTEMIGQIGKTYKLNASNIFDPYTNCVVGCMRLKSYRDYLNQSNPGLVTAGNMYCLHFLGMNGGNRLIQAAMGTSTLAHADDKAPDVFPVAALANPGIFYAVEKRPLTIIELYASLTQEMDAIDEAYATQYRWPVTIKLPVQGA